MPGYERHLTVVLILAGIIIVATVLAVLLDMPLPFLDG